MKTRWIKITQREAAFHPLYGVNGWAAFLGYGLIIQPILIFALERDVIGTAIAAAILWPISALLFRKNRHFIWSFLLMIALLVPLVFLGALAIAESLAAALIEFFLSAGWPLVWFGYVIVSRRVNVTFRHRVRPNELKLVWGRKRVDHFEQHGVDPGSIKSQKLAKANARALEAG